MTSKHLDKNDVSNLRHRVYEDKFTRIRFKNTSFVTENHMISRIPDEYKINGKKFIMEDKNSNEYLVEWYNDEPHNIWNPELTTEEYRALRKRAFEEESTLPTRFLPFVRIGQEGAEDVEEVVGDIIDLFVEPTTDKETFLSVKDLSDLVGFVGRNINKLGDVLTGKQIQQLADAGILKYEDHFKRIRSAEWRAFTNSIIEKFKTERAQKKINGSMYKGFKGIKLKYYATFDKETKHNNTNTNAATDII